MSVAKSLSLFRPLRWPLLLALAILLSSCSSTVVDPYSDSGADRFTGVTGSVVDGAGQAADGAWIYAYRSNKKGLRGPADFAARVDADGSYQLDLLTGDYWLVARMRPEGRSDSGPPRSGDAWAPYHQNPVTVAAGESLSADFMLQTVVQPTVLRQEAWPAVTQAIQAGWSMHRGSLWPVLLFWLMGIWICGECRSSPRRRSAMMEGLSSSLPSRDAIVWRHAVKPVASLGRVSPMVCWAPVMRRA